MSLLCESIGYDLSWAMLCVVLIRVVLEGLVCLAVQYQ